MSSLADLLVSYKQVEVPKSVTSSNFNNSWNNPWNNYRYNYETTSSSTSSTVPLTAEDDNNEIEFKWNYDGVSASTSSPTSSIPSIPGVNSSQSTSSQSKISSQSNSNVKDAMNYFINKGLTAEQASGFVGNFLTESNLNTSAINQAEKKKGYRGYGRGIAQWSNERVKKFEEFSGKKIEDASLNEQLDFVWHELNQRPELLRQLKSARTSDESADLVHRGYENGSATSLATPEQLTETYSKAWKRLGYREYNYQESLRKRQNKARQALNIYNS